jgi:type II secretory ATPase GspE/PulE/Tfp pilus assembly ATPase PilB-like protein
MAVYWRKLGAMLKSGVPLLQALEVCGKEASDPEVTAAVGDVAQRIRSGHSMSSSLEVRGALFPASVRAMVRAAEATGRLEEVCAQIADGLESGTLQASAGGVVDVPAVDAPESEESEPAPLREVSRILLRSIDSHASDIHLERFGDRLVVRYRVDGVLRADDDVRMEGSLADAVTSRVKIMAGLNVVEKRLPQDGRMQIKVRDVTYDFRVSAMPYAAGECIVIRILDANVTLPPLERQGLTAANMARVRGWLTKPNGIIIVTGPTGCGKTTTLYSMLLELNDPGRKIVTVEDPVEMLVPGVCQLPVRPASGLTFAAGLRGMLRQDPDVILIGEVRDLETAQIAVQAALTGHMVLTTLHTLDAPGALVRLIDIGIKPFLVNSSIVGVLAQRLVRMPCTNCRESYDPEEWVRDAVAWPEGAAFVRGAGCEACNGTGYRGRTAVQEVLEMDAGLRKLLTRDVDGESVRRHVRSSGVPSLRDDGIAKAARGVTTIEEVVRVCGSLE